MGTKGSSSGGQTIEVPGTPLSSSSSSSSSSSVIDYTGSQEDEGDVTFPSATTSPSDSSRNTTNQTLSVLGNAAEYAAYGSALGPLGTIAGALYGLYDGQQTLEGEQDTEEAEEGTRHISAEDTKEVFGSLLSDDEDDEDDEEDDTFGDDTFGI